MIERTLELLWNSIFTLLQGKHILLLQVKPLLHDAALNSTAIPPCPVTLPIFRPDAAADTAGHSKDRAHDDRALVKLRRQVDLVDELRMDITAKEADKRGVTARDSDQNRNLLITGFFSRIQIIVSQHRALTSSVILLSSKPSVKALGKAQCSPYGSGPFA